jgi:hypothetical protein
MEKIKIPVSQEGFCRAYITLMNGSINLTSTEIDILEQYINKYLELKKEGLNGKYLNKILFSLDVRKEIREKLNWEAPYFNNYFKFLKNKKMINKVGEDFELNPFMIPRKEITFEFDIK